ncbi:type VI secretion system tip protein TssI/VgrG [Chondromyces crocatus]|uniref:Type IV secretion protein Rhs n=1 Tax=Chondromyces crocatus TaxID=52 RepID=A0A0K1EQH9_CHOCO|nr:type VI secretion system tip protein TssI/VgrG [Chondromyces crocatus]AKT42883.1 uncharacterized protein CMC5_071110 [Chondromyces crocatus]
MPLLQLSFASGASSLTVRRFVVHEALSSLFTVHVWARGLDPSLDLSPIVGQAASLRVDNGLSFAHRPERLWAGLCVFAIQEQAELPPVLSTYRFTIAPVMWLLTRRSAHRIFQHLSIPDIIDKLLAEWRIEPTWEVDRGRYPKLEFKLQYGESDFAFVCRLLEEAGITFLFEDTADSTKLVFRDEPQTRASRGAPLPYYEHANQAAEKEFVTEVKLGHEIRSGAFVLQDYDFRRPALKLAEEAPKATAPEDKYELAHYEPGTYLAELGSGGDTPVADDKGIARYDVGYGKEKATRLLAGARTGKQALSFGTNALDLRPGSILSVSEHAHPGVIGRSLLVTAFSSEGSPTREWSTTVQTVYAEHPYRPAAVTPRPLIHGVQSATVVGVKTGQEVQEIHVDEFGRVRVQFPWDRDGKADDFASCWIRVSQGWAGRGYGSMVIPRVGQEVLVSFLDGDPDQPVITGRLFNALNPVPYKLPENKTISTWKSDSSPGSGGFNELKFEDRKGSELFYHQAEKNQRVLIKNDETITVLRDRRKDVTEDETETTGVDRFEVTLQNRSENTAINRTTYIVGDRRKWVKRDKGARVEGSKQTRLGKTLDFILGANKREWIQKASHVHVKGDVREQVDDRRSLSLMEESHEKTGGRYALQTGEIASYHAGKQLVGEGGDGMTVKGSGGFLSIGKSGIVIQGTMVLINEGASPRKTRRVARPVVALAARELKQPLPADVVEDARADEDLSTLSKHLAAVAAFMEAKPSAEGKRWSRTLLFRETKVFQRDDLIDPTDTDRLGRSNLSRMSQGLAPLGPDGVEVNLHHLIQSDKGAIAEVADLFHKRYDRIIHINPSTIPSGIDRKAFNTWRRAYWRQRAADLKAQGSTG